MFSTRYRLIVPAALLLFAVALSFADRRGGVADRTTPVAATTTESSAPADLNDRPLVLPDR